MAKKNGHKLKYSVAIFSFLHCILRQFLFIFFRRFFYSTKKIFIAIKNNWAKINFMLLPGISHVFTFNKNPWLQFFSLSPSPSFSFNLFHLLLLLNITARRRPRPPSKKKKSLFIPHDFSLNNEFQDTKSKNETVSRHTQARRKL